MATASTTEPMQEALISQAPGVTLKVGHTVDGFTPEHRVLNLSDTRLNQPNIGVVGDLGTGKTQLLKSVVYQIAKSAESNRGVKPRVLIFDYKKDYSSEDFVKAVGEVARQAGVAESGYRIIANTGADAHQEVPHLHVHIFGGKRIGGRMIKPD